MVEANDAITLTNLGTAPTFSAEAPKVEEQSKKEVLAIDVIEELTKKHTPIDSEHLKGHLNMSVIEDTFLVDADQKFPDSSIKINCVPHNAPAVFFSRQQKTYKCFKCLVSEQDLIYIDKRFKQEMEDFESIKENTAKSLRENTPNTTLIRDWKRAMRRTLLEVRQQFVDWIDSFTNKFVKSLSKIEASKELSEF